MQGVLEPFLNVWLCCPNPSAVDSQGLAVTWQNRLCDVIKLDHESRDKNGVSLQVEKDGIDAATVESIRDWSISGSWSQPIFCERN